MAKVARQRVGISENLVFETSFGVQEFASAGCDNPYWLK